MNSETEHGNLENERRKVTGYRTLAIVIVTAIVFTGLGSAISATSPTTPTVIQPGSMVTSGYYTIFNDGSTIYAKNGTTGAIDFSGTNIATVVNEAINDTPAYQAVYVLGNYNYTSNITLLKSIRLIMDGSLTAWHTDFLVIGDATHFVNGAYIQFGRLNGINLDTNHAGIRLRSCTAVEVHFEKILFFQKGIYFDAVSSSYSKGTGENHFYGGAISSCTLGISNNPDGPANAWEQGNQFFCTMWQFNTAGFAAYDTVPGGPSFTMNEFYGDIDAQAMNDPIDPSSVGGGSAIFDMLGGQKFYGVWFINYVLGPGSSIFNFGGETIAEAPVHATWSVPVGYNGNELGTIAGGSGGYPNQQWIFGPMPREVNITIAGSFNSSEKVQLRMFCQLNNPNVVTLGPTLWLNFTATGYYHLSTEQIWGLAEYYDGIHSYYCYGLSNQTATSVTMQIDVYD